MSSRARTERPAERIRPRLVFASTLVAGLVLSSMVAASDDGELDGLPIVSIVFDRNNIFDTADPATSAWPYRLANSLHVRSREGFIRSILLFEEGDPYSADDAAESARLLRSLGLINPVEITATRVDGGVEVTVETHDRWSLEVGADAGVSGDRGSFGFQLQEENLAGWGKSLALTYESDVERDAWGVLYFDPAIAGSRWTADLAYQRRTDGDLKRFRVERPFYAIDTERAGGVWWESDTLTEHLYAEGESVVEGRRSTEIVSGWLGIELGRDPSVARRLRVGWDSIEVRYGGWEIVDTATPYPTPEALDVSGPRIGYEQVANNYEVLRGFRAWSSQEDVGLGPNFSVDATLSAPALGGDVKRVLVEGRFSIARHSGPWLILGDVWGSGRIDDGDPSNVLVGGQVAAAQIGERGFQLRLLVEATHELDLDRQLTLGADVGLRGWDPDFFDGTGRALLNVQWRSIFARDVWRLFSVGALVFVDAGQTWDARVGRDTDGVRFDAGVGLIFDLSRFSTSNLLRLEIAWPDDGSGHVITIGTSALF